MFVFDPMYIVCLCVFLRSCGTKRSQGLTNNSQSNLLIVFPFLIFSFKHSLHKKLEQLTALNLKGLISPLVLFPLLCANVFSIGEKEYRGFGM